MPVSAFPSLSTYRPAYFDELEVDYVVSRSPPFADKAFDVNLDADQKSRRWIVRLDLTDTEASVFDAHADEAKYSADEGSAFTFNFTPRGGSILSGVRYARGGYRKTHTKTTIQHREILLEKLP